MTQTENPYDVLVIDPGTYTRTGMAIREALSELSVPIIEVHSTNFYTPEPLGPKSLIGDIATAHGGTAAQVAIAWVLSRSPRVVTIPGMKTRTHLADNLGGARLALTDKELAVIDGLAAQVTGERHPPAI